MLLMIHTDSPLLWRLGFMNLLRVEMKNKVVSEAIDDENLIIFLWEVAIDMSPGTESLKLLQEIVELWYAIKRFSITIKLLKQYKKATKPTTKGRKDFRKILH